MKFDEAQENMNYYSYLGGGTGVFASGIVWYIAGTMALFYSNQTSRLVLFFGGMFIHPSGMLLAKAFKRPGNHHSDNPLGRLALESTLFYLLACF